ncbi:MAG: hypothetical protein JO270_02825 [Acidobacteriaceae bacterium]|nr:hypothetical protein [Acidobacteriaceae bacterium]
MLCSGRSHVFLRSIIFYFLFTLLIGVGKAAPPDSDAVEPVPPAAPISHNPERAADRVGRRIWIGSMVAMLAATSFDAGTSWGKRESNGLLASSNGNFAYTGIEIKAAVAAAVSISQILLRRHKDLRTAFTIGNFAESGIFTAAGIHNLGISAPATPHK